MASFDSYDQLVWLSRTGREHYEGRLKGAQHPALTVVIDHQGGWLVLPGARCLAGPFSAEALRLLADYTEEQALDPALCRRQADRYRQASQDVAQREARQTLSGCRNVAGVRTLSGTPVPGSEPDRPVVVRVAE
jgi:hypothetical protein